MDYPLAYDFWRWLYVLALAVYAFACVSRVLKMTKLYDSRWTSLLADLKFEMRPFMPYAYVIDLAVKVGFGYAGAGDYVWTGFLFFTWIMDNDDDDRWRRRRKQAKDALTARLALRQAQGNA